MSIRPVRRIDHARPTMEGAGVHLHRAFGFGETAETDPFLLFFDSSASFEGQAHGPFEIFVWYRIIRGGVHEFE